jgi:hypothetical protein
MDAQYAARVAEAADELTAQLADWIAGRSDTDTDTFDVAAWSGSAATVLGSAAEILHALPAGERKITGCKS